MRLFKNLVRDRNADRRQHRSGWLSGGAWQNGTNPGPHTAMQKDRKTGARSPRGSAVPSAAVRSNSYCSAEVAGLHRVMQLPAAGHAVFFTPSARSIVLGCTSRPNSPRTRFVSSRALMGSPGLT